MMRIHITRGFCGTQLSCRKYCPANIVRRNYLKANLTLRLRSLKAGDHEA